MARVVLDNISKVYPGEVHAVRNVSLEIEDQEFVVLVGPSGCGKSTTLRMIAGLEEVTSGSIFIGDRPVNDVPPKDRDIAMVFQNYALYPHMSVYKNLAFGLKLRRYPKAEIERRVQTAAQILGIQELLDRKPKALSGGQRQRVAVGRAIVRQPKAFLFDEPLSNLDAKMRVQMRTEISKLHTHLASTMIYVTHDQVEAMTMGDRIVVMRDGTIQQVADPLTLYHNPANLFVAGFIGSPPMNFFRGRIVSDRGRLFFDEGTFRLRLDGEQARMLKAHGKPDVYFGIRPEDLEDRLYLPEADPMLTIPAIVEVIEPMGSEIYLYLSTGLHSFVARVGVQVMTRVNEKLDMIADLTKAHFFDAETERQIV